MIRYLAGTLHKADDGRVVIVTAGIGFDVILPHIVWQEVQARPEPDGPIELFISYHQTAQQPKPVLIGFTSELQLEFFEQLIKVKDIGPVMACKALTMPVPVIARAIEERDLTTITKLPGIGRRKAEMAVSELHGKVGKFAMMPEAGPAPGEPTEDSNRQVITVLVKQLGHGRAEAGRIVAAALERNPAIATPEELFEEVYRGTRQG